MAQINFKEKGITLIELLVYMSIFSIIFAVIMSSVFYMQKIVEHNNRDFYIRNQIYTNLGILQQYLKSARVDIHEGKLILFDKNNRLLLTQKNIEGKLVNAYRDKEISILEGTFFDMYRLILTNNNRILRIDLSWKNSRGKNESLTEFLIVMPP